MHTETSLDEQPLLIAGIFLSPPPAPAAAGDPLALARLACETKAIRPWYQPKITLETGEISGFEALLRWDHVSLGLQLPSTIAPAFADPELAITMGELLLGHILEDIIRWKVQDVAFGHIAINASAPQLTWPEFPDRMLACLRDAGLSPSVLELEVTESVFLERDADVIEQALRRLSSEGMRIALDDFGTGYASLTHLQKYPIDVIKIDRSFIASIHDDVGSAAIVRCILALGRNLSIKIVAEGIEDVVQAAYLWAQGCDYGQGYLFAKPMPASEVAGFLQSWKPGDRLRFVPGFEARASAIRVQPG